MAKSWPNTQIQRKAHPNQKCRIKCRFLEFSVDFWHEKNSVMMSSGKLQLIINYLTLQKTVILK